MFALLAAGLVHGAVPKICIGDAAGVPGSSGPPDWFTPNQVTVTSQPNRIAYQPSDPRWRGAMSLDYGSGSVSEVEYRALYTNSGGQAMLLSWQIKSTSQFAIDNTTLYAGFYKPAAGMDPDKGALLKITLKNTSTGVEPGTFFPANTPLARDPTESDNGVHYFDAVLTMGSGADPAGWTTAASPAWLTGSIRVWINAQTNPYTWTVQVRVPIAAAIASGLDLNPASFRMWNYAQVAVLLNSSNMAVVPYTWPRPDSGQPVLTYASYLQGINQIYPAASGWGEFSLVPDPASDASCAGVFLANDHIGTRSTPYNSQIKLDAANTFFAEPENKGPNIAANVVSATWRIANWGSQVGDTGANSWMAPSALTNKQGGAINSGSFGNIEAQWNPHDNLQDDYCPFVGKSGVPTANPPIPGESSCNNANPSRMLHQCILVKLQGPGLNFMRDSATRNMDFVKASKVEREAEISVAGLAALPAGKRDVFMYVERRNMPQWPQPPGESPPIPNPGGDGNDNPNFDIRSVAAGRAPPRDEDLINMMPTMIVHSYHDTGERIKLASGEYTVLEPQSAFGYFVTHDGKFEGWSDFIQGAERLRDDLYKVAPPNDGAVRVTTIIQAVEAGEVPVGKLPARGGWPWWAWVLIVLLIILVILFLRRRPAGP